jgi:putative Mn2+ efflux pump MntP
LEFSFEIIGYLFVALALAMLPFSVALFSSAYRCIELNESFGIGVFLSFFQAFLLMLGWWIGYSFSAFFGSMTFAVASMVFIFVGVKMFFDARRAAPERRTYATKDIKILTGFALVVSINGFLIGTALGMIGTMILLNAAIQVFITYLFVLIGIRMGKMGAYRAALRAESFGAALFLVMAVYMIIQYIKIL